MNKKYISKSIKVEDLVLDKDNPRFAELYNGSDKEEEIVEYLLYTESADEIATAISNAEEFYDDRPLWVYNINGKYIVKDGNRRCAAVKALQHPNYYKLSLPKFTIEELPVLEYKNLSDLDTRIRLEHNSNLFKKWGRIAKALEIYRLFSTGNSIDSLKDIDSNPLDFIKIATFYYKAAEIKGEHFKQLVREGKGKTGGKTIVFERLFRVRQECGYSFKHTGELFIKNNKLFESYINAIVPYLIDKPDTTSRIIDNYKPMESFLELLKPLGFTPKSTVPNNSASNPNSSTTVNNNQDTGNNSASGANDSQSNSQSTSNSSSSNNNNNSRYSKKKKPDFKRKKIPSPLITLINECYKLDHINFANAKTALVRVTFECTLKYIVENTDKGNGKTLDTSNYFQKAFKDNQGNRLTYTNFDVLKNKFTDLITPIGIKKAFGNFDLQNPHQIIHNYLVGAVPADALALANNLIPLLGFMLQEESELIKSIDTTKL